MKPEITYLAWSVLLAIVHMLITVVALVQHSGMAVALGNRANLPELPGWGGRAGRANDNMAQNLVLFAAVYRLYDSEKRVFAIAGRPNLREALREKLGSGKAAFFDFELNEMYTARESELIQQHLAEHGEMPEGDEGLDDLF